MLINKITKNLTRLGGIAEPLCQSLAGSGVLLLFILLSVEIFSRFIFSQSNDFILVFTPWIMAWIVYLMIGILAKHRQHIAVDILPSRLADRQRTVLLLIFDLVNIFFGAILCWAGIEYAQMLRQLGIMSSTRFAVPVWIPFACVPLGGILFAFFSIGRLVTDIHSLKKFHRGKG